jgi:hypothetical protein
MDVEPTTEADRIEGQVARLRQWLRPLLDVIEGLETSAQRLRAHRNAQPRTLRDGQGRAIGEVMVDADRA